MPRDRAVLRRRRPRRRRAAEERQLVDAALPVDVLGRPREAAQLTSRNDSNAAPPPREDQVRARHDRAARDALGLAEAQAAARELQRLPEAEELRLLGYWGVVDLLVDALHALADELGDGELLVDFVDKITELIELILVGEDDDHALVWFEDFVLAFDIVSRFFLILLFYSCTNHVLHVFG